MVSNKSGGAFAALIVMAATTALGQQPLPPPYDGIRAGLDAFLLAEEQRRAGVAEQVAQIDVARFGNGYFLQPGTIISDGDARRAAAHALGFVPAVPPFYAARYVPARQPSGQLQMQTGPNRWESHPVYEAPLTPYSPRPIVAVPVLRRELAAPPPVAAAAPEWIPPPPPAEKPSSTKEAVPGPAPLQPTRPRGPREY